MFIRFIFTVLSRFVPNVLSTLTVIETLSPNYKSSDFFFVQIGANDGNLTDPINKYIHQYSWKGILVEPIPSFFKDLKKTYKGVKGLTFVNAAISDKRGTRNIYKVDEDLKMVPTWFKGIASFDKDVVLKHSWKYGFPDVAKHIVSEKIRCITLVDLFKENNVKKVDLLLIDVEGHEAPIIRQLPKTSIKPSMIFYEYVHMSKKEQKECKKILKDMGYTFITYRKDILAHMEQ